MGFLRQITGQKAKGKREGTCKIEAAAKVIKEATTQSLEEYIDKQQETVTEWVLLRPIMEIYDKETGYKGGGRHR